MAGHWWNSAATWLALVTALVAQGAALAGAPAAGGQPPNILFCIADDWGWPHAGAYGDPVVRTPTFDRVAREGVLFRNAFVAAPTCTASRGAILTGQAIHRLEEGGNLWSFLRPKFVCYPDLLAGAGYAVGLTRKGWGPGTLEGTGRAHNPAGPSFRDFRQFHSQLRAGRPFCFWFGSIDPHRPYDRDSGVKAGLDPQAVRVPPTFVDTPTVRSDLCDYYFEVQRFDREVGEILKLLEEAGQLENTLVVMTADNGMPFPRCKATLYDGGTRVPLAIRWPARVPGGRVVDDFVSLADMAPTFLEVAGLTPLGEMTARSLLGVLTSRQAGRVDPQRDKVFTGRERHAQCRPGNVSYPIRAVRTAEFLYIRNFRPQLDPAGTADIDGSQGAYSDIDASPTKSEMLQRREEPAFARMFELACGKRPAEELYDLAADPHQLENVAAQPRYAAAVARLRGVLEEHLAATGDPRARGETDFWDKAPYVAGYAKPKAKPKK